MSPGVDSGLYCGRVTHLRLRPREHRLAYRAFWLLLDLDQIDQVARRLRLFSRNRFNLVAFHDADHGAPGGGPLRLQIERRLAEAGVDLVGGPIRLLTFPRVLGYVFNPLSLYYCYRPDGDLAAMVYEVHNTFGERHCYVLPVDSRDAPLGRIRQGCDKAFYVSPFLHMDMTYGFSGAVPDETLKLVIEASDAQGPILIAAMTARRRGLSDAGLAATLFRLPFATLKVMAAIHWEALKLWLKRVPLTHRPGPVSAAPSRAS